MSLDGVIKALRDRDACLYLDGAGTLRYAGPKLPLGDPIRLAIAEHRPVLIELFTYAPEGRCVADGCYRLRAGGDRCPDHQHKVNGVATSDARHQSHQEAA